MTVTPSILPEHLAQASPDLLRELLSLFLNALLASKTQPTWRRAGRR